MSMQSQKNFGDQEIQLPFNNYFFFLSDLFTVPELWIFYARYVELFSSRKQWYSSVPTWNFSIYNINRLEWYPVVKQDF
jgi:hypothetical protein